MAIYIRGRRPDAEYNGKCLFIPFFFGIHSYRQLKFIGTLGCDSNTKLDCQNPNPKLSAPIRIWVLRFGMHWIWEGTEKKNRIYSSRPKCMISGASGVIRGVLALVATHQVLLGTCYHCLSTFLVDSELILHNKSASQLGMLILKKEHKSCIAQFYGLWAKLDSHFFSVLQP